MRCNLIDRESHKQYKHERIIYFKSWPVNKSLISVYIVFSWIIIPYAVKV